MINDNGLRFLDAENGEVERPPTPLPDSNPLAPPPNEDVGAPSVFVRSFTTPIGWPWEQARAAELEARHAAPLPLEEVLFRVRRIGLWRPGGEGRHAAFYVLKSMVRGRLEATAEVEGRPYSVAFQSHGLDMVRAGSLAVRWGIGGGLLVLLVAALIVAVGTRAETSARLGLAEQKANGKLRRLEAQEKVRSESSALAQQLDKGARLKDALADVARLSDARQPDAMVEAVYWRPNFVAVEARGEESPFGPMVDRPVRRSPKPLRPGVWLWAIGEPTASSDGPPS